jgi:hypothetical protein
MRMTATVRTPEAEALAIRMRKHFAHKVPVDVSEGVSRVRIPAGEFELEALSEKLAVRACAVDAAGLARVKEVVGSHLTRFARDAKVELEWASLETRAETWVAAKRNGRHLVRTRDWALRLEPNAPEALRLAALLHDVDRHAGDVPLVEQVAASEDDRRIAEHADRAARLAAEWLRSIGADQHLAETVEGLIRLHEVGGTRVADILQASDSLSFLEVNPAERWVREELADRETAERKLRRMYERIRVDEARALARPLLDAALRQIADSAPAKGAGRHANGGRAHGNTR